MTPAQIARLAAYAPPDPDPARCGACGARSEAPTLCGARIGALYVCAGCGAAWWAQAGVRDAVCGSGGVPAADVPLVRAARPARVYRVACRACQRPMTRPHTAGQCATCYRAAVRASTLPPAKQGGAA